MDDSALGGVVSREVRVPGGVPGPYKADAPAPMDESKEDGGKGGTTGALDQQTIEKLQNTHVTKEYTVRQLWEQKVIGAVTEAERKTNADLIWNFLARKYPFINQAKKSFKGNNFKYREVMKEAIQEQTELADSQTRSVLSGKASQSSQSQKTELIDEVEFSEAERVQEYVESVLTIPVEVPHENPPLSNTAHDGDAEDDDGLSQQAALSEFGDSGTVPGTYHSDLTGRFNMDLGSRLPQGQPLEVPRPISELVNRLHDPALSREQTQSRKRTTGARDGSVGASKRLKSKPGQSVQSGRPDGEVQDLKNQVQQLTSENQLLGQRNRELAHEISELNADESVLAHSRTNDAATIARLNNTIEQQNQMIETLKSTNNGSMSQEKLTANLSAARNAMTQAQQESQRANQESLLLRNRVAQLEHDIQRLTAQRSELVQEKAKVDQELVNVNSNVEMLIQNSKNRDLVVDIVMKWVGYHGNLQNADPTDVKTELEKFVDHQKQTAAAAKTVPTLQTQLEQWKSQYESERKQRATIDSQLRTTRTELTNLQQAQAAQAARESLVQQRLTYSGSRNAEERIQALERQLLLYERMALSFGETEMQWKNMESKSNQDTSAKDAALKRAQQKFIDMNKEIKLLTHQRDETNTRLQVLLQQAQQQQQQQKPQVVQTLPKPDPQFMEKFQQTARITNVHTNICGGFVSAAQQREKGLWDFCATAIIAVKAATKLLSEGFFPSTLHDAMLAEAVKGQTGTDDIETIAQNQDFRGFCARVVSETKARLTVQNAAERGSEPELQKYTMHLSAFNNTVPQLNQFLLAYRQYFHHLRLTTNLQYDAMPPGTFPSDPKKGLAYALPRTKTALDTFTRVLGERISDLQQQASSTVDDKRKLAELHIQLSTAKSELKLAETEKQQAEKDRNSYMAEVTTLRENQTELVAKARTAIADAKKKTADRIKGQSRGVDSSYEKLIRQLESQVENSQAATQVEKKMVLDSRAIITKKEEAIRQLNGRIIEGNNALQQLKQKLEEETSKVQRVAQEKMDLRIKANQVIRSTATAILNMDQTARVGAGALTVVSAISTVMGLRGNSEVSTERQYLSDIEGHQQYDPQLAQGDAGVIRRNRSILSLYHTVQGVADAMFQETMNAFQQEETLKTQFRGFVGARGANNPRTVEFVEKLERRFDTLRKRTGTRLAIEMDGAMKQLGYVEDSAKSTAMVVYDAYKTKNAAAIQAITTTAGKPAYTVELPGEEKSATLALNAIMDSHKEALESASSAVKIEVLEDNDFRSLNSVVPTNGMLQYHPDTEVGQDDGLLQRALVKANSEIQVHHTAGTDLVPAHTSVVIGDEKQVESANMYLRRVMEGMTVLTHQLNKLVMHVQSFQVMREVDIKRYHPGMSTFEALKALTHLLMVYNYEGTERWAPRWSGLYLETMQLIGKYGLAPSISTTDELFRDPMRDGQTHESVINSVLNSRRDILERPEEPPWMKSERTTDVSHFITNSLVRREFTRIMIFGTALANRSIEIQRILYGKPVGEQTFDSVWYTKVSHVLAVLGAKVTSGFTSDGTQLDDNEKSLRRLDFRQRLAVVMAGVPFDGLRADPQTPALMAARTYAGRDFTKGEWANVAAKQWQFMFTVPVIQQQEQKAVAAPPTIDSKYVLTTARVNVDDGNGTTMDLALCYDTRSFMTADGKTRMDQMDIPTALYRFFPAMSYTGLARMYLAWRHALQEKENRLDVFSIYPDSTTWDDVKREWGGTIDKTQKPMKVVKDLSTTVNWSQTSVFNTTAAKTHAAFTHLDIYVCETAKVAKIPFTQQFKSTDLLFPAGPYATLFVRCGTRAEGLTYIEHLQKFTATGVFSQSDCKTMTWRILYLLNRDQTPDSSVKTSEKQLANGTSHRMHEVELWYDDLTTICENVLWTRIAAFCQNPDAAWKLPNASVREALVTLIHELDDKDGLDRSWKIDMAEKFPAYAVDTTTVPDSRSNAMVPRQMP